MAEVCVCAETVLEKIKGIIEKVQSTLTSVEQLQEKLKSQAEEIKNERAQTVRPYPIAFRFMSVLSAAGRR